VVTADPIAMRPGTLIEYRLRLHRLPVNWLTRIESWLPGRRFEDRQLRGPYRLWHHTHTFEPYEGGTRVRDLVRYAMPLGPLGRLAHAAVVRRDLERIFDFRRDAVAAAFGGR
jgi:ligand-binding SRPBCC domain-containing protein